MKLINIDIICGWDDCSFPSVLSESAGGGEGIIKALPSNVQLEFITVFIKLQDSSPSLPSLPSLPSIYFNVCKPLGVIYDPTPWVVSMNDSSSYLSISTCMLDIVICFLTLSLLTLKWLLMLFCHVNAVARPDTSPQTITMSLISFTPFVDDSAASADDDVILHVQNAQHNFLVDCMKNELVGVIIGRRFVQAPRNKTLMNDGDNDYV
jgi:hypothetical protein